MTSSMRVTSGADASPAAVILSPYFFGSIFESSTCRVSTGAVGRTAGTGWRRRDDSDAVAGAAVSLGHGSRVRESSERGVAVSDLSGARQIPRRHQLGSLALKLLGQVEQNAVGSMAARCRDTGGAPT